VLLDGFNHVALISGDIERLRAFYTEVFDAEVGPPARTVRRATKP
jgi:catechol 2,3-dioxygenase-like lactoylglutathione lyase family enzyme